MYFYIMFFSVFTTNNNLGVGIITGSEIINIFGIMAVITYKIKEGSEPAMDQWFFVRNSLYYMLGCGLFVVSLQQESIVWYMALILFLYAVMYLVVLWKSEQLRIKIFSWLDIINEDEEFFDEELINMKTNSITIEELIDEGFVSMDDDKFEIKILQCQRALSNKDLGEFIL